MFTLRNVQSISKGVLISKKDWVVCVMNVTQEWLKELNFPAVTPCIAFHVTLPVLNS